MVNAETVDLYWFRPSIDDRVVTLRLVSVNLCVGLILLYHLLLQGCLQPLFISVEMAVERLDREVYFYYLR
jgi:multisubunit Na+/H+ antiporter MnhF subunit